MKFMDMFDHLPDERSRIVSALRESKLPLVICGGEESAEAAKAMLAKNGLVSALHCVSNAYALKRSDLYPLEKVHERYPLFNVFLGIMEYHASLDDVKDIVGINQIYYCDLDGYIPHRKAFNKSFLHQHGDSLAAVYDMLNDALSKESYIAYIKTRISGDCTYINPCYQGCKPYFDPCIVTLTPRECFVDGGAFTGDTIRDLIEASGSKEHIVYAFEPDVNTMRILKNYIVSENIKNATVVPKGLWHKRDVLCFNAKGNTRSALDITGSIEIDVDCIDNLCVNEPVTFIKMDIEGAEFEALQGASETIKRFKPSLAISIYHKDEDLFKIPLFIKELCPDYTFDVRTNSRVANDFVLHAYMPRKEGKIS